MMMKTPITLSILATMALTACADPNAYPNDPNARAKQGALTGAVFGGIVGAATNKDNKLGGAIVGAALGAAAGGIVGQSLDQQAADLRASMGNANVTVTNMGDYLVVNMPQDLLFATDSTTLRPDLQSDIRAVASNLLSYPNSTIEVVGHTDSTGSAAYNMDLSQRRAIAVADVLMSSGVPSARITAYGRGEDQPIASNATPAGQAMNRRVEIIIRPTK